jgi:hypothetical protein
MPSASTTSAKTFLGEPGDVRCDKFTTNSVLCDHLVLRDLKIVCPGCREEHDLAEIIREARANGANTDNLLRDIFKDQQLSLASEISHANMLAQQILRPLRQKLQAIPCKFSPNSVEKLAKKGHRLIRIAGGLDVSDIEKAAKLLGGDMCVYPEGHFDYGYTEFDDSTIGRRLKLGNQLKTTDQFIFWPSTSYDIPLYLDFSKPDTLDAQLVKLASVQVKPEHHTKFQIPRLADFMFALLVERLKDEILDKQETWVKGAALKLVDNGGQERTGEVINVIDNDFRSNDEDPTAMVVDVIDWGYVGRVRQAMSRDENPQEEPPTNFSVDFKLCPWFVAA